MHRLEFPPAGPLAHQPHLLVINNLKSGPAKGGRGSQGPSVPLLPGALSTTAARGPQSLLPGALRTTAARGPQYHCCQGPSVTAARGLQYHCCQGPSVTAARGHQSLLPWALSHCCQGPSVPLLPGALSTTAARGPQYHCCRGPSVLLATGSLEQIPRYRVLLGKGCCQRISSYRVSGANSWVQGDASVFLATGCWSEFPVTGCCWQVPSYRVSGAIPGYRVFAALHSPGSSGWIQWYFLTWLLRCIYRTHSLKCQMHICLPYTYTVKKVLADFTVYD